MSNTPYELGFKVGRKITPTDSLTSLAQASGIKPEPMALSCFFQGVAVALLSRLEESTPCQT